MATLRLTLSVPDTQATLTRDYYTGVTSDHKARIVHRVLNKVTKFSQGLMGGSMLVEVVESGVQASGTVTCASAAAADTVTVAGRVLTAVSGTPSTAQFKVGVSDTADALSLVSAINSHATLSTFLVASSAAGVVTVKSLKTGAHGNGFALASSNGTRLAVSGALLTGGSEPQNVVHYG